MGCHLSSPQPAALEGFGDHRESVGCEPLDGRQLLVRHPILPQLGSERGGMLLAKCFSGQIVLLGPGSVP